jgi:hypothetical protein
MDPAFILTGILNLKNMKIRDPLANSTGGQQQISRVSFYGESSQIALGTAVSKEGGPEGTYSFEALLGQYSKYWRVEAFYQHSQDLPSLSFGTTVPAPGDITVVVLVDKTEVNKSYMPVPATAKPSGEKWCGFRKFYSYFFSRKIVN